MVAFLKVMESGVIFMEIQIDRALKWNCFLDQPVTTWPVPVHLDQNARKSSHEVKSANYTKPTAENSMTIYSNDSHTFS